MPQKPQGSPHPHSLGDPRQGSLGTPLQLASSPSQICTEPAPRGPQTNGRLASLALRTQSPESSQRAEAAATRPRRGGGRGGSQLSFDPSEAGPPHRHRRGCRWCSWDTDAVSHLPRSPSRGPWAQGLKARDSPSRHSRDREALCAWAQGWMPGSFNAAVNYPQLFFPCY